MRKTTYRTVMESFPSPAPKTNNLQQTRSSVYSWYNSNSSHYWITILHDDITYS